MESERVWNPFPSVDKHTHARRSIRKYAADYINDRRKRKKESWNERNNISLICQHSSLFKYQLDIVIFYCNGK